MGLMIGVELVKDKKSKKPAVGERQKLMCKALEKGLLLLPAGKSVIRICPPLILPESEAERGLDIIDDSLNELK